MSITERKPTHPGVIIKEDYLKPLSMSMKELALLLEVSRKTISNIVNGRSAVTPRMALRLGRALDTSAEMWLNLQKNYDLWCAEHSSDDWRKVSPLSSELLHRSE